MKPTFYIITKGYKSEFGFFVGVDSYHHLFSMPKNVILQNKIESIGNKYPFFCLSNIENSKLDTSKNNYRNSVPDIKLFLNIVEVIQYVCDLIPLNEQLDSNNRYIYLTLLKSILFDYDLFKEKTNYLKINSFGYNRSKNDLFHNLPYLLLSTSIIYIKPKLDKYINFYGYDSKTLGINKENKNYELRNDFPEFEEDSEILWNLKNSTNYAFTINLLPLYYEPFKKDAKDSIIQKDVPYMEIVTFETIKKFKVSSEIRSYFDQFYKLKNDPSNFNRFELKYELDERTGFRERLKKVFDNPYVYTITPVIDLMSFDKTFIEKMHKDIIGIFECLIKEKVSNVIILPSLEVQFNIAEDIHCYFNPPDDNFNCYDALLDLADEEMRKWDEETDGFWRIENDFG